MWTTASSRWPHSIRPETPWRLGYGTLWIVGQDGILRADCQPALGGLFVYTRSGRVTNPPQVANLPHGAGKAGSFRAAELGTALTAGTTSD